MSSATDHVDQKYVPIGDLSLAKTGQTCNFKLVNKIIYVYGNEEINSEVCLLLFSMCRYTLCPLMCSNLLEVRPHTWLQPTEREKRRNLIYVIKKKNRHGCKIMDIR